MRTFSFGAGVQSTAVLVLQALGKLPEPYDVFLFANVGDDSEDPRSLDYYREHHIPFAKKHGIELIELHRVLKNGSVETIWNRLLAENSAQIPIPIRMSNGAPGTRGCTSDFKIRVIRRWQRANGSCREDPAITGLGISVDEIERARDNSGFDDQILEYPLLQLQMNRKACYDVIKEVGLPAPPKSACFFCPFHNKEAWRRLKIERRDLFDKSVYLEQEINKKRDAVGKDHVWLTRYAKPLDTVVEDQLSFDLDGPEDCDSGYCFT
jgi:hypothetical protein